MVLLLLRRALPNIKVGSLATILKYMMTDDCILRDALVDTPECDREKTDRMFSMYPRRNEFY